MEIWMEEGDDLKIVPKEHGTHLHKGDEGKPGRWKLMLRMMTLVPYKMFTQQKDLIIFTRLYLLTANSK